MGLSQEVPIDIPEISLDTNSTILDFISCAALFVNVTAKIFLGGKPISSIKYDIL